MGLIDPFFRQNGNNIVCGQAMEKNRNINSDFGLVAYLLKRCYRCGRWGVRIPSHLNLTLCRQRLATAAMILGSCVPQVPSRGDDPITRHTFRCTIASMMKN